MNGEKRKNIRMFSISSKTKLKVSEERKKNMAKAVLVMDMPESCCECNLNYMIPLGSRLRCHAFALGKAIDSNTREKPDWCPLRELPERETEMIDAEDLGRDYVRGTMDGWNACLDEIESIN